MADNLVQEWLQASHAELRQVEEERVVTELSGCLDLGTISFPEFIRSITGRVENEPDLTIAGRGLSLLPRVLAAMQTEATRNDVHALVPYLCAKLEDASPGVLYISESLRTIATWKKFPPGDAPDIARAIFKLGASNNFSSQTALTRLSLYELADTLKAYHSITLKRDMTIKEFVKGVVTMAELEKSPSCLRALFGIYANLSREWALASDDYKLVFDSYIRYFPVTMKDSPKDPSIPSSAELRDLLLQCFVSSDGYSTMTFEAMMERLDVDSANTKLEVFRTLESGIKSYSVLAVSKSVEKLWDTIKFEIWNGSNDEWIQSSLNILRCMAASLDRAPCDWLMTNNPVHKFVVGALAECRTRITDDGTKFVPNCGRIFKAIASACPYAFYLVAKFAVPILDTLHQANTSGPELVIALQALNGILAARLEQVDVKPLSVEEFAAKSPALQEYQQTSESHMVNGFSTFRDRIVEIYHGDVLRVKQDIRSLSDLSFGVPAIQGLLMIFRIPSYLSEAAKGLMVGDLIEIALNDNHAKEIREEALSALSTISVTEPLLFQDVVLPVILAKLPLKLSQEEGQKKKDCGLVISLLESLVRIGATSPSISQKSNFVAVQEKLVQRLVDTLPHDGQSEYQHAILASFSAWYEATSGNDKSLTHGAEGDQEILVGKQFDPIHKLLSSITQLKTREGFEYVEVIGSVDEKMVRLTGEYIMKALRSESNTPTDNFLVQCDLAHLGASSGIWTLFTPLSQPDFVSRQIDLSKASKGQCLAVILSMYMVAGCPREDMKRIQDKFDIAGTASAMLSNSVASNPNYSSFTKHSVLNFLWLLVNKFGAAKLKMRGDDKTLTDKMREAIDVAESNQVKGASKAYQTLAYFAAASLAALDPSASSLIQLLIDNLANPKYGRKVAQAFRLLLGPSEILNRENFCYLRPLRKGRLYELGVKPLIALWKSSQDPILKENAIIAVVGIIAFLEPAMLADNAKDILPVLLEGTNIQEDKFAKEACTKAILSIIPLSPQVIEEHLNSVVDRMTDRVRNTYDSPSDSSVQCRSTALEVLSKLTEYVSTNLLLKKKPALDRELDSALEDVSFEVRHKAVDCKMAWFNLKDAE